MDRDKAIEMIDFEIQSHSILYNKMYERESNLQDRAIQVMRKLFGNDIWLYKAADKYCKGVPDIVGCIDGQFFGIELKALKGKPTKLQEFTHNKIREAGGIVCICKTVAECLETLKLALMI